MSLHDLHEMTSYLNNYKQTEQCLGGSSIYQDPEFQIFCCELTKMRLQFFCWLFVKIVMQDIHRENAFRLPFVYFLCLCKRGRGVVLEVICVYDISLVQS